ncbi:MAG TPA: MBL fold metallo-hydrolase [Rugosimonospora sp.]|nr:MBL fold metallo-hydrolase [Rugosimonospora sp.]
MRLTVLGGQGAWPEAGRACGGYLVEYEGFRLLVDPGYATVPRLLERLGAGQVDAVYVSHGHPDHCADLNPLLRARVMGTGPLPPLPVYALPGALDAVLALDRPGLLDGGYLRHELRPGEPLDIGPLRARTALLPHSVPNAGLRLAAGGQVLAYTGDSGPDPELLELARDADILLAEASFAQEVPDGARGHLSSAADAGRLATAAGVGHLMLTHLLPGTDADAAQAAARAAFPGAVSLAHRDGG